MLKPLRNRLHKEDILLQGDGTVHRASWSSIRKLERLQSDEGLSLANNVDYTSLQFL